MSTLAENVAKVTAAHAALKTAIAAKGVAVPDGTKLTGMPALVGQIETTPVPTNPRAVFAYDSATRIVVPTTMVVDVMNLTNIVGCFYNCNHLTSLTLPAGFGQTAVNMNSCFFGCSRLTSLMLPDGFGHAANNTGGVFRGCDALTDITGNPNFKASLDLSQCPNLTHDSLMVVINGLQTVTGKTLTLGATNLAKLTDAEKKVATDKGWTLA